MAYNNYFPMNYQPAYPQSYPQSYQQQMPQVGPQMQRQNTINWVQGLEGAKAHPVGAGEDVVLFDSESDMFFIKSADQSGMPSMRVFRYNEVTNNIGRPKNIVEPSMDMSGYVTKEEFEERLKELTPKRTTKKKEVNEDAE